MGGLQIEKKSPAKKGLKMFDKKMLLQHINNTSDSKLQEQGSPIMKSERGRFFQVGRAATEIAAQHPDYLKAREKADAELRRRVAARRQGEIDRGQGSGGALANNPNADWSRIRYNQLTGEYENIIQQHHDLHLPRIESPKLEEQTAPLRGGESFLRRMIPRRAGSMAQQEKGELPASSPHGAAERGLKLIGLDIQTPSATDKYQDPSRLKPGTMRKTGPSHAPVGRKTAPTYERSKTFVASGNAAKQDRITDTLRKNKDKFRGKSPDEVEAMLGEQLLKTPWWAKTPPRQPDGSTLYTDNSKNPTLRGGGKNIGISQHGPNKGKRLFPTVGLEIKAPDFSYGLYDKIKGLFEAYENSDYSSAVNTAVKNIKKIKRSDYPEGSKGNRLYNTEVEMHVTAAKRDFHSKYHNDIHKEIMSKL